MKENEGLFAVVAGVSAEKRRVDIHSMRATAGTAAESGDGLLEERGSRECVWASTDLDTETRSAFLKVCSSTVRRRRFCCCLVVV
jgi:hypothetical protein